MCVESAGGEKKLKKRGKLKAMKGRRKGLEKVVSSPERRMGWEGWRKVVVVNVRSVQGGWTLSLWFLKQKAGDSTAVEQVLLSSPDVFQ